MSRRRKTVYVKKKAITATITLRMFPLSHEQLNNVTTAVGIIFFFFTQIAAQTGHVAKPTGCRDRGSYRRNP